MQDLMYENIYMLHVQFESPSITREMHPASPMPSSGSTVWGIMEVQTLQQQGDAELQTLQRQ